VFSFGWMGSLVPYLAGWRKLYTGLTTDSRPEIAVWATGQVAHLDREIEKNTSTGSRR
jgi:hypothetical protein